MTNSFFSRFTPKEPKFFPLFNEMTEILLNASDLLIACLQSQTHKEQVEYYKKIKDQERAGDRLTHKILDELDSTFITPFDREDIHNLVTRMDDVTDGINSGAKRIALYNPERIPERAVEMAKLIKESAICIQKAVQELDVLKHSAKKVKQYCKELHEIENRADDVYEDFIIDLFEEETNSKELIKVKEIVYELEKTTDEAERVGKIIRTIIIKYA